MYCPSFLDLPEAGSFMVSCGGRRKVGVAPTKVLHGRGPHGMWEEFAMKFLLVQADRKMNSSGKIAKSGMFVSEKLLFAHLIFWSV